MDAFSWVDKVDDVDLCKAEDVNSLAQGINAVISELNNNYYSSNVIDGKTAGKMKYKGKVSSYALLPNISDEGDVWVVEASDKKKFYGVTVNSVLGFGLGMEGEGGTMVLSSVQGFGIGKTYIVADGGKNIIGTITPQSVYGSTLEFEYSKNDDYYTVISKMASDVDADFWNTWMSGSSVTINKTYYFYNADFDTNSLNDDALLITMREPNTPVVKTTDGWQELGGVVDFSDYYTASQVDEKISSAVTTTLNTEV